MLLRWARKEREGARARRQRDGDAASAVVRVCGLHDLRRHSERAEVAAALSHDAQRQRGARAATVRQRVEARRPEQPGPARPHSRCGIEEGVEQRIAHRDRHSTHRARQRRKEGELVPFGERTRFHLHDLRMRDGQRDADQSHRPLADVSPYHLAPPLLGASICKPRDESAASRLLSARADPSHVYAMRFFEMLRCRFVWVAALSIVSAPPVPAQQDPTLFNGLRYRMVGPNRGGRSTAVTGVPGQPYTYYMGVASGGVWKTADAGQNWFPISDGKIPVASIGAIEVAASDPNTVYVGTGSDDIRSNVSIGRGVYKSSDAGQSWTFVGLRDVGQIGTIRVHPSNPDVVYLSATGNPFRPNAERGVYRSRDGGRTWANVLYVSDSTGAADVELQPGNPDVVYAVMWRGERKPWTIISGAREGGIYRSIDAGDHWTKLTGGLPTELVGKGNLAVTQANPRRLYLLYEAKPGGGLYPSDDAGATWTMINSTPGTIQRPLHYVTIA